MGTNTISTMDSVHKNMDPDQYITMKGEKYRYHTTGQRTLVNIWYIPP
jgi:hypothetical protein